MNLIRQPAALLACIALLAVPAAARAQSGPRWSGLMVVAVQNDTPNGRTVFNRNLTVMFDSVGVNLQGPGDPLVSVRTIAVQANIDNPGGGMVYLSQHLRGFLNKPVNARVVIMAEVGGVTRTVAYPWDVPHAGDITIALPATVRWPVGRPWAAVITVVVERGSTAVAVRAGVDSIDATVDAVR